MRGQRDPSDYLRDMLIYDDIDLNDAVVWRTVKEDLAAAGRELDEVLRAIGN